MSAVAERLVVVQARVGERWRIAAGLAGLLVVSLLLRSTAIHARYWIDEGLSVGIAKHQLTAIPGLLRQDGSPPLYYLILGVWIRLFGDGEARTHALSLGFALLTIPLGFVAGRALFSPRAGWMAATMAALVPFLSFYGQETRMYSLVVLLSMATAATYALVFIRGRRRLMPAFVVCGAALIYTHSWGLFMLAGTGLALLPLLRAGAVAWRDALIGYGAIAVLYLPWVPTVLYQAAHTGAPWSNAPSLGDLPGALATVAGGTGPGVALLLVGGSGVAAYWTMRRGPIGPPTQQSATVTALGAAILIAIALAFIASQISPGWTLRYFAAVIGPLILLSGGVLARAGNLGLVTVALLAGLWLHPPTSAVNGKSNVHQVAVLYGSYFRPGDVVVSTHPEQTPVAHFYFPHGLRWGSAMGGWWPDTGIMDWRDVLTRYRDARVPATASALISALRPGQQLILILPVLRTANWNAPWTHLVKRRSIQWHRYLNHAPRLEREHQLPHLSRKRLPHGIRVVLYRRIAAPH